jgi:oligosaccharyltransferase complex subunit epsilon
VFESTVADFWRKYSQGTPVKIKLVDSFILYLISIIVWQVFYRLVSGTDFPKNTFLSGIFTPLGVIVMTVALRMHIVGEDGKMLRMSQTYRALWEYLAGLVVLFVVAINFLG